GVHSMTALATDAAGNSGSASAAIVVTVDSTAPAAPSLGATDQLGAAVANGATVAASALTLSGSTEANDVITISDGATTLGTVSANGSGAWSFSVSHPSDATHLFGVTSTDLAGNVGAAATLSVTIDTHVPGQAVIAGIAPDSGVSASDGITNTGTVTIS